MNIEFNSEVNWKFLVWTDLVFELLLCGILTDFCFPTQVRKDRIFFSSPVLEQVHSFPHNSDSKIRMSKTDTLIFYMQQIIFFHGLISSIFSFSGIQSPSTFFKFLLPQCMEESGHAMGWVLWHEAAAPALFAQLSVPLWTGPMIRLSLSSQPNLARSGHREHLSVPPFPHWDLFFLRGAQCSGCGWPAHALVHSDEVSELKEIEGMWRGEQEKQVFMFWEAHC